MKAKTLAWLWNLLISIDQFANVLLAPLQNGILWLEMFIRRGSFGVLARFGYPDETLSSVYGKNQHLSLYCAAFAWILNKIDRGHTDEAKEPDEGNDMEAQ